MLLSISNKVEVDRQTKRNKVFFWLGVAGLLLSMTTLLLSAGNASLAGLVFLLGYPFLIIGLVLSKRGAFNNRRHGIGGYKIKSESALISEELASIPPRYHLYNWINLKDLAPAEGIPAPKKKNSFSLVGNKNELFIEHLLVTPLGLMIIMSKNQMGDIKAGHDHYRRKMSLTSRFASLGEPGLGKPSLELSKQVKTVRSWFESRGYEIPVDGVVVFNNPRTKILGAEEMSFPVCHMHDLKQVVRGWETELNMSVAEQQEIEDLIIKSLPASEADEARTLAQMPGFKRMALLNAQKAAASSKEKDAVKEKKALPKEEAPKPKLTPEERERLRLEKIRAAEEKGRQPVNPYAPVEPGKRVGINGKVREVRPATPERKATRRTEPLRKPPPGAFGDYSASQKKK